VGALKNLFGKDLQLDKLPAELKPLVEQMRQERTAYEALLKRAEQLGNAQQIGQIEQRLSGLDKLAAQAADFRQGAASLEDGQQALRERLDDTRVLADTMRADLEGMRAMLAEILAAKTELPALLELLRSAADLRAETAAMDQRLKDGAAALGNLQDAATRVQSFAGRAEKLEGVVEQLQQLLKEVPDVKRELSSLNVLAEYVTRKVSALEAQRDLVDRATQRAERLTELVAQVDRQLQQQHQNMTFLERLEKNVDELRKQHQLALERAGDIDKKYRAMDAESRRLGEQFIAQKESLQQAASRFAFERDGLEGLSRRITELREALGNMEQRLPEIDRIRTDVSGVLTDVKRLTTGVADLQRQVGGLESSAATAQAAQVRVTDLSEALSRLSRQVEELNPAQLSRELAERAAVVEEARSRLAGIETRQADWASLEERTDQLLALAQQRRGAAEALQADLLRLFNVADSTVAQVRGVIELQQQIDQRRQLLEPVLEKVRKLDRQAELLDERQKQFTEAEERLARLDALLIDLQSTFQLVLGHKEFLERVVETAGNLALQTMQAEAMIGTLRAAGEDAKERRARS
jgi:DNA repair exonuclease SbcCD ATPase subunit